MRFPFPLLPASFEIPDPWLQEAGFSGAPLHSIAYSSTADASLLVPLRDIEPPFRDPERPLDANGFSRERMVHVIAQMIANAELDPVPMMNVPPADWPVAEQAVWPSAVLFRYRIRDGMHRFYASVALGYTSLPGRIVEQSLASK